MRYKQIYVGIDPGKSGGITALDGSGGVVCVDKMPPDPMGVSDLLEYIKRCGDSVKVMVERVHSSPQMGVKSAFTFGEGYGILHGCLCALKIPHDIVRPQVWQKELGCMSKGDKNVTKARAAALFPAFTVTHAVADSMLIAEYCRRIG